MMANNEYIALKKCTEKCVAHFAACNFITTTAKLFGEDLIPLEVYTVLDCLGSLDKANKITQALIVSVNAKPQKFKDLIVLLEKSDMSELAKILRDKFGKYNIGHAHKRR